MFELNNIYYRYGSQSPVIKDLSLKLDPGRIYGLLGVNGVGKTTLLNILSGQMFPMRGTVLLDGRDLSLRDAETLQNVVMMPSEFYFTRKCSIPYYVSLFSGMYPDFNESVLDDCLKQFGIDRNLTVLGNQSLGQKHKILFSILLSLGTRFILMDEPFNGMDMPSRSIARKLLIRHLRDDQSVIVSTHVAEDIDRLVTDLIIMKEGGECFCDSIANLSEKYSFGIDSSGDRCVYYEKCAEGYRVIRENRPGEQVESDVCLRMLFNAVINGYIK